MHREGAEPAPTAAQLTCVLAATTRAAPTTEAAPASLFPLESSLPHDYVTCDLNGDKAWSMRGRLGRWAGAHTWYGLTWTR